MTKNKKELKATQIVGGAVGVVIGAVGGFSLMVCVDRLAAEGNKGSAIVAASLAFILFALFYMVGLIIHEAGHLVFGLATGYKFLSFRIGSFTVVKEHGKLVQRKFTIPGTAGQCLMTHESVENPEDMPYFWYHFGGGFFNIICAVIGLLGYIACENKYAEVIFVLFCGVSALLALMNLIPLNMGVPNDGYNIYLLHKSALNRKLIFNSLVINGMQYKGTKLRDMPDELFEGADAHGGIYETSIACIAASKKLDKHDFQGAKILFLKLLDNESLLGLYRNECKCELMFTRIVTGDSREEAEEYYDKALKQYINVTGKTYIMRKRLMFAYYLIIEKDREKAQLEYDKAVQMNKTYPCRGEYDSEMELIEYVRENFSE